jgi:hypothetical protein
VFSCSKSEQKQLNTWVSFQSAEQRLLGQFSISGNSVNLNKKAAVAAFSFKPESGMPPHNPEADIPFLEFQHAPFSGPLAQRE